VTDTTTAPAPPRLLPKVRRPYPLSVTPLVKRHRLERVVEVGTGDAGVMRMLLLTCPWVEYAGVDAWDGNGDPRLARLAPANERKARLLAEAYPRAMLLKGDPMAAADRLDDGAAGLVLLTAVPPGGFEAALRLWLPKVAEGGWLAGAMSREVTAGALASLLPGHTRRDALWSVPADAVRAPDDAAAVAGSGALRLPADARRPAAARPDRRRRPDRA
jgi:hypothetical protein